MFIALKPVLAESQRCDEALSVALADVVLQRWLGAGAPDSCAATAEASRHEVGALGGAFLIGLQYAGYRVDQDLRVAVAPDSPVIEVLYPDLHGRQDEASVAIRRNNTGLFVLFRIDAYVPTPVERSIETANALKRSFRKVVHQSLTVPPSLAPDRLVHAPATEAEITLHLGAFQREAERI